MRGRGGRARRRARLRAADDAARGRRALPALGGGGGERCTTSGAGRCRRSPRRRWRALPEDADRFVALGGGRVIDVAKAVAAARGGGARAMAVPTTLSGAELTSVHRHAEGVDDVDAARALRARRLRPGAGRVAAGARAGGERAERAGPRRRGAVHACSPIRSRRSPRTTPRGGSCGACGRAGARPRRARARRAARGLRDGLDRLRAAPRDGADARPARPRRRTAAPTRSCSRTRPARSRGASPRRSRRSRPRSGEDPAEAAARLCERTGATRLRDVGARRTTSLDACADAAAARPQLDNTPPRRPTAPRSARSTTRRGR